MRARRKATLLVLTFAVGSVLQGGVAHAQTTYDVLVGQFLEAAPASESMRFFPGDIDVHQGDTLRFTTDGFHTATFLPPDVGPVEWFDSQASLGTNQPFALVEPDEDDGPDAFKINNNAVFPSDPDCGGPAQPACTFDGSSVLNSGAPFFGPFDFAASVDVGAGSSFYVVCIVHGSNMRMKVDVVGAGDPASDPGDLEDANAAALRQDVDTANALHERFSGRRTSHAAVGGARVWDAWAGVDSNHVALYGFYPRTLRIDRGDRVQWHFDSLSFEDHTATIPSRTAREIVRNAPVVCDPDGDAGPGPDNPPDLEEPPFCSDPAQLEIEFDDRFVPGVGNGTFTGGADLESSGVRGANAFADRNYVVRFAERSSDRGFRYLCLIHPFMRGRVVVG
jgi:plastocyanin